MGAHALLLQLCNSEQSFIHCKLKRSVSAPKCQFSPSWSHLSTIQAKKSSIKRLFQPTVGTISALGPNQPQLIGLYWPRFKGAKSDPKIGLYFTYRNGPVFRAKPDLSDLECSVTPTQCLANQTGAWDRTWDLPDK